LLEALPKLLDRGGQLALLGSSPAALASGVATGVQFNPINAQSLSHAFGTLCDLYAQPDVWKKMQRNAMKQSVGWDTSAAKYAAIYNQLISDIA